MTFSPNDNQRVVPKWACFLALSALVVCRVKQSEKLCSFCFFLEPLASTKYVLCLSLTSDHHSRAGDADTILFQPEFVMTFCGTDHSRIEKERRNISIRGSAAKCHCQCHEKIWLKQNPCQRHVLNNDNQRWCSKRLVWPMHASWHFCDQR